MSRAAQWLLLAALAVMPLAAVGGPQIGCDSNNYRIDASVRFHGDDLVFRRGGATVARITGTDELLIDGKPVDLTPAQHFEVAAYRAGYEAMVVQAREIGTAGARFGTRTVVRVISALFTGGAGDIEEDLEADATELKLLAEGICLQVEDLNARHVALAAAVPAFGRAVPLKD